MTADLSALIARLEAAEVGSRELDARMWCATEGISFKKMLTVKGFPDRQYSFRTSIGDVGLHGLFGHPPIGHVTTSLDAALALAERVLPGCGWELYAAYEIKGSMKYGCNLGEEDTAYAFTPALALCIAILRAKAQEG